MADKQAQAQAQAQRIRTYCETIWGKADYDIDVETDDWISYVGVVKIDYDLGPPRAMTDVCGSDDQAWKELERMLGAWATQVKTGRPMTREESLSIFGGPKGRNKFLLNRFLDVWENRERSGQQTNQSEHAGSDNA